MFQSAEHALSTAFFMLASPISPKSNTQRVIEHIRERFDPEYEIKAPSHLTPHEWRAQAVYTISWAQRILGKESPRFHVLQAKYNTGVAWARSVRIVSEWLVSTEDSRERLLADLMVCKVLRGLPTQQAIADRMNVDRSTISRWQSQYAKPLREQVQYSLRIIEPFFIRAAIVNPEAAGEKEIA